MVEANYISNTIYIVLNAGRQKNFFKCKNNYYFNISNYYSNNLLYESTTLSKLWSKILFLLLSSFLVTLFLKYNSAKIYLNFCTILSVCLLSILINFKFENDLIPFNLVKKDLDPIFLKMIQMSTSLQIK